MARAHTAVDLADALSVIESGMTVAIGGALNSGHPMALIRALMQRDLTNLTIASGFGGFEIDMLAGSGIASRIIAAFVGSEGLTGLPPLLGWAVQNGHVEAWDIDEGILLTALRAAAQKVPFTTWRCGLGTDAAVNPLCEPVTDDATGTRYLRVLPLEIDACLYWAEAADCDGNVLGWGPDFGDTGFIDAAARRIVQVERIVSTDVLQRNPDRVAPWQADIVAVAPLGTFPFASTALCDDLLWLEEYGRLMTALRRAADWNAVRPTLERLLQLEGGDDAFLEKVGVKRLRELLA